MGHSIYACARLDRAMAIQLLGDPKQWGKHATNHKTRRDKYRYDHVANHSWLHPYNLGSDTTY